MTRRENSYLLPEVIDPQRIRFCIEIPDDLNHIIAFWGALGELEKAWNWEWDGNKTGLEVARVWQDVVEKARVSFLAGDCASEEICQFYRPTSARLEWFPENPYHPEPEPPEPFLFHPFTIVDNSILGTIIGEFGLGYKVGDVYTDITKIPIVPIPPAVIDALQNLPGFIIKELRGTGTVKLHFLNIPQGGRALIQLDNAFDLFNLQFVELNKDQVSVPWETQTAIVVEVPIETDGDHEVKVTFFPVIDDSFLPIFFGGGFRGFELCGFGREGCSQMSEDCCDELGTKMDETNKSLTAILNLMKSGFKIVPLDDSPSDFKADCSPAGFSKDTDESDTDVLEDRATALCLTAARYILATLYRYGKDFNMSNTTKADILALMDLDVPPDFWSELRSNSDSEADLGTIARIADPTATAFEAVLCKLVLGLKDKANTFANFKTSLALGARSIYPDNETYWLTKIMYYAIRWRGDYNIFARELNSAYEEIVDGLVYECPCGATVPADCILPLELVFKDGRGTLIELVGDDLYHFTGDPSTGPPYVGGVYLKDANNQCFELSIPPPGMTGLPIGWVQQFTEYHYLIGCCDSPNHEGTGGWENGTFTEAYWDCGDETPVDTYYVVKCKDTSECE